MVGLNMSLQNELFLLGKMRFLVCMLSVACAGIAVATEKSETDYAIDNTLSTQLRVEQTNDLTAVGALSQKNGVPILLMFSTEDCSYCKQLEAEVLGPMRKAGIDPKRVILRKVMMDEYDTLRDFSGRERNADSFATSRGIDMVPTLELLDAKGKILVPKIVGYQTPGVYDVYLEQAIEVSQSLFNKQ